VSHMDINMEQTAYYKFKKTALMLVIIISFALGLYSLILAYASADKIQTFTNEFLIRIAAPSDSSQIATAFGNLFDKDFIFVVLDTSSSDTNPFLELSAQSAAQVLADSGLASSVRIINPKDSDFEAVVKQNKVGYFPAVLAVKRDGGIILITDDFSEQYLLFAYTTIWGKTSDCSDDKSAVY